MVARLLLLLVLGSLAVPPAHAADRSITSFAPDSALLARRGATPPGMVDLPVWIGTECAPVPLAVSVWHQRDRHQGSMPWYGVSGSWPTVHRARRWIAFGYSHFVLDGAPVFTFFPVSDSAFIVNSLATRVTLDAAEARSGADWLVGSLDHPWAYLGAGYGAAFGWGTTGARTRPVAYTALNALLRAGLLVRPTANTQISLGVMSITGYHYGSGDSELDGMLHVDQAQLSIESRLRLPKRLLPAP